MPYKVDDLYVSSPKIENLFYTPSNWGYSSTNTASPGTSLWSFTYNAPVDGYIIASTNAHWQNSNNGAWLYSWISIDGKNHNDSSLYDITDANNTENNSGNYHEYRHNDQAWQDYNFSTFAYVSQGSRTISLHVRSASGTVYINGAAIRLLFIPKNYM